MFNIIKSDLFRIFKGKGIYIILICMLTITLINAYSIIPIHIGIKASTTNTNNPYGMSEEWYQKLYETKSLGETRKILIHHSHFNADTEAVASNTPVYYLIIFFIIAVSCSDFTSGTIKNSVTTNISKKKYYFSKLTLSLIIGLGCLFTYSFMNHFMYLFIDGKNMVTSLPNLSLLVVRQIPIFCGIISVLVTISVLVRKTSVFNTIAIPLIIVSQLILTGVISIFKISNNIFYYEFETALRHIIIDYSNPYMIKLTALWIGILIVTSAIGYINFKKRDI